MPTGI
jgi:hypothetical protein